MRTDKHRAAQVFGVVSALYGIHSLLAERRNCLGKCPFNDLEYSGLARVGVRDDGEGSPVADLGAEAFVLLVVHALGWVK